MDPITILSAFLPLLVHGGKAVINKWLGQVDFKPATIEEYSQLKDKDLQLFEAINKAGGNNPSYAWVEAVIRLQRPFVVVCVLSTWAYGHYIGWENMQDLNNAASIIGFYLFGDRTLFYATKKVG